MRSELLLLGTVLGALVIIFSRPGPQLWTVAFLVVLLLYGLAFADTYGFPWVEEHGHRHTKDNKETSGSGGGNDEHHHLGGGWRHY